jgi:asparagine synthase (glutamine-hydrolysing)
VPREGYDGPDRPHRIVNEGPYAAATAALYSNVEHVLVRGEGCSMLDLLDRNFFLFDQPSPDIYNASWGHSICDTARERKLKILLTGQMGNLGLSYDGSTLLPELFRTGRWAGWWRETRAVLALGRMRWRGVFATTFGPWCPSAIWVWLNKLVHGSAWEIGNYTAINLRLLAELNLPKRARDRELDFSYRPWKDGFAERLWALRRVDLGNSNKGTLGGWHIDVRDPTADVRLLEFCLAVPTEQFQVNGIPRALARLALADRLPKIVLENPRKGMQVADWHERLTAERHRVAAELDRLDSCPPARRMFDLPRLHRLVENWPLNGWERAEIHRCYRLALLRGISTGYFVRRVTGTNA